MKHALLDPTFFDKIKRELAKVNSEVHHSGLGGSCSQEYCTQLSPETCHSELRQQVHFDPVMKQYIASKKQAVSQTKTDKKIVNKPEYVVKLDMLMKKVSKI